MIKLPVNVNKNKGRQKFGENKVDNIYKAYLEPTQLPFLTFSIQNPLCSTHSKKIQESLALPFELVSSSLFSLHA